MTVTVATPALLLQLPDYIPAAVQSFDSRPIHVGDAVTVTLAGQTKRYVVTAVNEKGEGDLAAVRIQ